MEPSPRKRKPRKTKSALADLDANAPRLRAPRAKRSVFSGNFLNEPAAPQQPVRRHGFDGHHPPRLPNPLAVPSARRYDFNADEEFRLTMAELGSMSGPKKRTFSIFQDGPEPEISPVRTESPLEDPM